MKIVIITTALSDNYGAALQTYALAEFLKQNGYYVDVYNYNNPKRISGSMTLKQNVIHRGLEFFKSIVTLGIKKKRFEEFRNQYIPLTKKKYKSNLELNQDYGDYDVYISGSDQIWNPDFFVFDTSYFLDFLPEDKFRISYASSFGKATFGSEKYSEKCGRLLSKYNYISVREKSGINIVNELCKQKAHLVLDPTLLLNSDSWVNLCTKECKDKFILCYIMPGDKTVVAAIDTIARMLQDLSGLRILRIGIKEYEIFRYKRNEIDLCAGPIEFLNYFKHAEYVVTNSFHGTAFGINFQKKLYVPINDSLNSSKALHERIMSLLELFNATEVLIPVSQIQDDFHLDTKQEFMSSVGEKLELEREKSKQWLLNALNDCSN